VPQSERQDQSPEPSTMYPHGDTDAVRSGPDRSSQETVNRERSRILLSLCSTARNHERDSTEIDALNLSVVPARNHRDPMDTPSRGPIPRRLINDS
jgi:hypothetical protein